MAEETKTEEPPAIETITVKVDGKSIEVPKLTPDWQGNLVPTTVLQACKHAGLWRLGFAPEHKKDSRDSLPP